MGVGSPLLFLVGHVLRELTLGTWLRFLVWMAVGLVIYFGYSRSHSCLARGQSVREVAGEKV